MTKKLTLILAIALLFILATKSSELMQSAPSPQSGMIEHVDEVLGVTLNYPTAAKLVTDQYLGPDYGFTLVGSDERLMLRVGWLHDAAPSLLDATIQVIINSFPSIAIKQDKTKIDGRIATTLSGVPGMDENTYILITANERLYQLIYGKGAIGTQGSALLNSMHFFPPTKDLSTLKLVNQADTLKVTPPGGNRDPGKPAYEWPP